LFIQQKKAANKSRHEERHRRRREETKDPSLREARLAKNKPLTLEDKRIYDNVDDDHLGANVDLIQLRRRRLEQEEAEAEAEQDGPSKEEDIQRDDDLDSMLGSDDGDDEGVGEDQMEELRRRNQQRMGSLAPSTTSTNMDLTPASLMRQFPSLFSEETPRTPKILVTTSLNSTLHREAKDLATLFPNSTYIPRSAHRYGHKYSVREIAKFGTNRGYTALVLVREDQKQPTGLSIIHLNSDSPPGPTLTFSITN
jgi:ribosome production factor 1